MNKEIKKIESEVRKKRRGIWRDKKFVLLLASVIFVISFEILELFGWELPKEIAAPLFGLIIIVFGHKTIRNGLKALVRLNFRSINLLMLIAVIGAFYVGEYVEAAVVITLFSLGERLERYGIEASKSSLKELLEKAPNTATLKRDFGEETVSIEKVEPGDILVIRPADVIAADASIVEGFSSVDESTITGEPIPRDKHTGDKIFAGTVNLQGYLEARVMKKPQDSTLAKIVETTFQATKTKAETQKFIEKFSSYYTPTIILIAVLIVSVPTLLLGKPFEPWLLESLTLLVIACPCALVISTPISIYSAVGAASKRGVLIKGGKYVEALGQIKALAMDKTRTLTYGKPLVTDIVPFGNRSKESILACVGGIEMYSEHPFAKAITNAAKESDLTLHTAKNFEAVTGKGVKADCVVCYDSHHCVGKLPFITEEHKVQDEIVAEVERLQKEGKTSIVTSTEKEVTGIIALADELKEESLITVRELKALGVEPVMLTGDNASPAQRAADSLGIERVEAELLPDEKSAAIEELRIEFGGVGMVGDGVNDAPALAGSNVGISMGAAGSDTAIEVSDVAILNDRLVLIPYLIRLGRKTISTIRFNTIFAIATKLIVVVLAILGLGTLTLAIFADVGVTIIVMAISLRLLKFESGKLELEQPGTYRRVET